MNEAESIYLNKNEHYRAVLEVQTREDRFIERVKKEFPLHEILRKSYSSAFEEVSKNQKLN
jgi:Xaa-Pro aminopeptidase